MDIGPLRNGINEHMFFMDAINSKDTSLIRVLLDLDNIEQTRHGISDIIQLQERDPWRQRPLYQCRYSVWQRSRESRVKSHLALNWRSIMALSFLQRRRAQKAHKEQQKNHKERDCEVLRRFFANNHPKVYESGQVCPLCRKRKIWPLQNRVVAIAVLFY